MLQKTHVNGFRTPKYAGEQREYVTCQACVGEMWQALERDLGLLLEAPDYIEKVLNSGYFIFYGEEQYKFYPNRIYQYTFSLSDHERILMVTGRGRQLRKGDVCVQTIRQMERLRGRLRT